MKKKKYKFVIMGSGIGGMALGGLLSKRGSVLVLEKNENFGGYCSSFKRNGFDFEIAVQAINGVSEGATIHNILKNSGALEGINFITPKQLYRTIFPSHELSLPQRDIKKYLDILSSMFPKERRNIEKLFDTMMSIHDEMNSFHKFFSTRTLKKSPFTLKYYRKSLKFLLDEFLADGKLKAIISQYWVYRGLPPSKLSSLIFSYIWYDYTVNGSYYPEKGMYSIIANMMKVIRGNNGEVLGNKTVSSINLDKNRVSEIVLENGERYSADTFISNMDIFNTFNMLTSTNDEIETFRKKIGENSLVISAFKVYLGLSKNVRDLGITDYEIFVNPGYDIEAMYKASLRNDVKNMPFTITIYSNLSGSFCKKGQSVMSIGLLSGYDYWKRLSKAAYKKRKQEMTKAVLARCEEIIPNLRKYIKTCISATPLTMERYTGNSAGSIFGWHKKKLSEEIRYMNPTTPVSNLMLASHWTKIGGGVGGVLLSSDRVYSLLNGQS